MLSVVCLHQLTLSNEGPGLYSAYCISTITPPPQHASAQRRQGARCDGLAVPFVLLGRLDHLNAELGELVRQHRRRLLEHHRTTIITTTIMTIMAIMTSMAPVVACA